MLAFERLTFEMGYPNTIRRKLDVSQGFGDHYRCLEGENMLEDQIIDEVNAYLAEQMLLSKNILERLLT